MRRLPFSVPLCDCTAPDRTGRLSVGWSTHLTNQAANASSVVVRLPVHPGLVDGNIQLRFADIDTDIAAAGITVVTSNCAHISPLLHSSSRLFRLFELGHRIGAAPALFRAAVPKTCGYSFGPLYIAIRKTRNLMVFRSYKSLLVTFDPPPTFAAEKAGFASSALELRR